MDCRIEALVVAMLDRLLAGGVFVISPDGNLYVGDWGGEGSGSSETE
jgi:hypothetical protein